MRNPILDIFDEGDHLTIVMELIGAPEEAIFLKTGKQTLTVSANLPEGKYQMNIHLPEEVNPTELTRHYKNNVLEIRISKAEAHGARLGPLPSGEGHPSLK